MKQSGWRVAVSGLTLLGALVLLNLSLTFANVWPTLAVRATTGLSLELAVCVLVLAAVGQWMRPLSRRALHWLAGAWVALVIGRYVDVTARSLYGRDVNLYWDARHLPNVGAMFAFVADPWLKVAIVSGVIVVPVVLFFTTRWALRRVSEATRDAGGRAGLAVAAGAVLAVGAAQGLGMRLPDLVRVVEPMTPVYAREVGELAYEMSGAGVRALDPEPVLRSDFSRVSGADVVLVFLESYGAVSWERPEFSQGLAESRTRLTRDIRESGHSVVSGLVESTTFGGESWLSHVSLLAGTEVRDEATNVRLMAQERETLPKAFGREGYRTVAIMPGVLVAWPQGAFYGFDEIYDLDRLDYRGPPFGWWNITDQFALARMHELELARSDRRPVFAVFPTITTHAPFVPAPPYQEDWSRMLTTTPYDGDELDRAWSDYPDWLNLGPSYVKGLRYAYATLGGYLREHTGRDLVLIVVGDHQPPALVSGEGASWNVPMHVVSRRPPLLDRLKTHGFREGLRPAPPVVARMDGLLEVLLDAFGDPLASDREE